MLENLQLQFFAVDKDNRIIQLVPDNGTLGLSQYSDDYFKVWQNPISRISTCVAKMTNSEPIKHPETIVQILFVKKDHLTEKQFFHNLGNTAVTILENGSEQKLKLRETRDPLDTTDTQHHFYPIITIGMEDIMSIYEESPNLDFETNAGITHWHETRKANMWLYEMKLDARVKFLDSSIWHRYVAYKGDFEKQFTDTLKKIITYSNLRLYRSLAALSTLEFQCRMLQNSAIAKYGDHGHHEAVTPFKFHSETIMEGKIEKFNAFFAQKRNDQSLQQVLKWKILLIDDHANLKISIVKGDAPMTKREIIKKWLEDFALEDQFDKSISSTDTSSGTDTSTTKIINDGIGHLKDNTFDIILLDYLIGDSEIENKASLKAYGHEFLLELATSNARAEFRRGPFGRFWIFPISSFPFAFNDKLRQLNIDGSNEQWYIASGGDPISTPALFRLNFCRLLMRQISETYLHEAALARQLSRYDSIKHLGQWCRAMISRIDAETKTRDLLMADRDNNSLFAETMEVFLEHQKQDDLFLETLKNWLRTFSNYRKGTSADGYINDLKGIESSFGGFSGLIDQVRQKALGFINDAEKKFVEVIKGNSSGEIKFDQQYLHVFPVKLPKTSNKIKKLSLSGNRLTGIHPSIGQFTALTSLDLSQNYGLEYLPAKEILESCTSLTELNLTDTKLGGIIKKTQPDHTTKALPTKKLLESIVLHNERNALKTPKPSTKENIKKIFISYSHIDTKWKDELKAHLRSLKLSGLADVWADSEILPGERWDNAIQDKLKEADIVLLLLSSDFMASGYIQDKEIKLALQHDKKVVPIYLRPCSIDGMEYGKFQGLPSDGYKKPIVSSSYQYPDEGFVKVVEGLRKIITQESTTPS